MTKADIYFPSKSPITKLKGLLALLISLLSLGCSGHFKAQITDTLLNLEDDSDLSIKASATNAVFQNPKMPINTFEGKCIGDEKLVLLAPPIREIVNCEESKWSFPLNLDALSEGSNQISITDLKSRTAKLTITKKFQPSYLTILRSEREFSTIANLFHSPRGATHQALIYSSDEACQASNCATTNISLRLRSENYQKVYFVTSDLKIPSSNPQLVILPNNDFRIFYLSSDSPTGAKNIYYRDFSIDSKLSSPSKKITDLADGVLQLHVFQQPKGEIHLFYISKEYCLENNCTVYRPAWRRSSNKFIEAKFPAPGNECNIPTLRAAMNHANGDLHLTYKLYASGNCTTTTGSVEHIKFVDNLWTASPRLNLTHFGASQLAVDNDGGVFLFYRSTWDGGCSSWQLNYRFLSPSETQFSSSKSVGGGYPHAVGYPGDDHQPGLTVGDDGKVYLVTMKRNPGGAGPDYSLHFSSSADNFMASQEILRSEYANGYHYPTLIKTETGFEVFTYQSGGNDYGLIRFAMNNNKEERTNLIGASSSSISPFDLGNGRLGLVGNSRAWCDRNGCSNFNFYLEDVQTKTTRWLTEVKQEGLELRSPLYIQVPNQPAQFFYASNERKQDDPDLITTSIRSSDNSFATRTHFTLVEGGTSGSPVSFDVDNQGHIHLASIQSHGLIYQSSKDGYSKWTKVNHDVIGSSNVLLKATNDGDVAIMYGGNNGGSHWSGKIRWSKNDFAAEVHNFVGYSIAYGSKTMVWNPNRKLEIYKIVDGNNDGRLDIVRASDIDNFAAETTLITFPAKEVCRPGGDGIIAAYDNSGRLYLLFSAKDAGSNVCKLYLKRSDDWTQSWKFSYSDLISYNPLKIVLRENLPPVVCARSSFSLSCFDSVLLGRSAD